MTPPPSPVESAYQAATTEPAPTARVSSKTFIDLPPRYRLNEDNRCGGKPQCLQISPGAE